LYHLHVRGVTLCKACQEKADAAKKA